MTTIALWETGREKQTELSRPQSDHKAPMALISGISARQRRQMDGGVGAAGLGAPFPGSLEIQRLSCPVTQQQENIYSPRADAVPAAGGGLSTGREGGSRREH